MIIPNSEGNSEPDCQTGETHESPIREAWSPAARAAAAASRKARGQGKMASKIAGREAYGKAAANEPSGTMINRSAKYPSHSVYAAQNQLKHFRSPGLHSTHFKDPQGKLHVHDSKSNTWKRGKERAKGYKLGSKKKQAERKEQKQRQWNARYD